MSVFSHPEFDQHQQIHFINDTGVGLQAIIAIHNTQRGPALGGCRMWPYPNDEAALRDVLRLSRGMTYKSALAGLPLGGGKSVIIGDPRRAKSTALLASLGRQLERLGGQYIIAEDSGIQVTDLQILAKHTRHVAGITPATGLDGQPGNGDPSPATAYGVFIGLKAALQARFGHQDLHGIRVAIQGVGSVGMQLAELLHRAGARLWVSDLNQEAVQQAVQRFAAQPVDQTEILYQPVDILAPCAMGAILNQESIPRLQAKVIAGAANNQLAEAADDRRLTERGIVYAPDFAINAGGVIQIAYEQQPDKHGQMRAQLEGIGTTLQAIFHRAAQTGEGNQAIALALAKERLASTL